uniref:Uncharacterized protein n=1 Tax=Aegilops tauschii subsp. strangulata TaxID=200361 RepID=A0A453SH45_AEGTS
CTPSAWCPASPTCTAWPTAAPTTCASANRSLRSLLLAYISSDRSSYHNKKKILCVCICEML